MTAKAIFILCASALVAQCALGECFGRVAESITPCRTGPAFDGFGFDGPGYDGAWSRRGGCFCGAIAPAVDISAARSLNAAYGGGLSVSSSSCAAPTGLAITSENAFEGVVAAAGNLPFLGTAAMEGVFPTAGTSVISYGCGDGAVAITAEEPLSATYTPASIAPAAIASAAFAPGVIATTMEPWGYAGLPARGCGCGCGSSYVY